MSAENTNDTVSTLKRLYPRALVLTSAVVFGGIAIAQAQKYAANPSESASSTESALAAVESSGSGLIPLANRDAGANNDAEVELTSGELPPAQRGNAFADVDSSWATEPPADFEQDTTAWPNEPVDDAPPSNEADLVESSPGLADPVAFPSEVSSAPLARRGGNPYRDAAEPNSTDDAGLDASESVSDLRPDAQDDLQSDQIALPEIDSTALPASRYSQPRAATPQALPADDSELTEPLGADEHAADQASDLGRPGAAESTMTNSQSTEIPTSDWGTTPSAEEMGGAVPPALDQHHSAEPEADLEPDAALPSARASNHDDPIADQQYDTPPDTRESELDAADRGAPTGSRSLPPAASPAPSLPYDASDSTAGGRPGPQTMEGPQSPSLTIHKRAPEEIQVGRPAKFEILVRNTGRVAAENVVIRDQIPLGTNFVDSAPKASRSQDGALYWEVGSLAPGQEIGVSLDVMPTAEGQIGSVATVSFAASASAKTRATKPELIVEHSGPVKVLVGEAVQFSIKLSNPGTGAATQVVLEEDVPSGLAHSSGSRLEYEVGMVEPGQTRHLELTLKADKPGHVTNTLIARADGGLVAQDVVELEVVSPELQVAIEGPNRRYLDRQATFTVAVANPGTAPARNVELISQLPTGLKFVSTNNSGFYDQSRHAIIWSLEQLPAGEMGKAQFTAMPIEMGEFQIHAQAQADMGLQSRQDHALSVEGIAALFFGVVDKIDPIEVGGETTYEIKVVNQGSKAATNVQFAALLPEGLQAVGAQGPTQEALDGQRVMFAAIPTLAPQEQAIFHVTVSGRAAGDHRFRVQMTSDETTSPVIKEESTRVYSD